MSAVIAPAPALPASTHPVSATTMTGRSSSGQWSTVSTRARLERHRAAGGASVSVRPSSCGCGTAPGSVGVRAAADLHRASAGRDLRPAARGRTRSARSWGSTRSSVPTTTCASVNGDGRPGPTDAWVTLAALGRETATHPARHAGHAGDLPLAGSARDPGRASRRDERRTRRARHRRGLVRRRARRLRDPLPRHRHALRDARGAARDPHRHVGHARRRALRLRRHATTRSSDSPALPEARAAAAAADHHRWLRHQAHAAPRGDATPTSSTCRSRRSTTSGPRATSYAPRARPRVAIPRRCGTRSRSSPASAHDEAEFRRRAAAIGHDPDQMRAGGASGTRRRGRRSPQRVRPPPARRRCTCRSSTSTTSISSN